MALAVFRVPPFTSIFLGALAGGVLAAVVGADRIVAFADPAGELPRSLAIFKGIWLALASGYHSSSGHAAIDTLASRAAWTACSTRSGW